ncbi:MAG: DUF1007 family protein [Thermodesulfobacteriota bacterium]|nr:DUF1007 family protein [Thermodesulfobacteriota bacterium]
MKLNLSLLFISVVVGLMVFSPAAYSHPHVFVVNKMILIFDDHGFAGIRVNWSFDEFFSSMIAGDYDKNRNKKFEKSEIAMIKKEAFSYLLNFDYFSFIKIDGKPFKVKWVTNFIAALSNGKISYEFLIPCHVKASSTFKEITIAQYDPTYYSAVILGKNNPVKIEAGPNFETGFKIAENLKESYYYGMVHPVEVILKFRLKNN